jgi:hypothetical protein
VHRTWRFPFNVPSWTSCGCSKHASVIIDHLRTTDPPQDDNLKVLWWYFASAVRPRNFQRLNHHPAGATRHCRNPSCKTEKVCPTSCRNKGTRPLPYSWETSPLPARRQARANAPGAPQASVFRVQKRRPSKILTTRQQLSITDQPLSVARSMSDSDDKKRNKLGYQRISIACGMPSLPCSFPSLCRVDTRQVACYCAMLTL